MVKALRCDHEFVKLAWKGHEYGFFDYNIRKVEWFSTEIREEYVSRCFR